jgi:UPF0755 protein
MKRLLQVLLLLLVSGAAIVAGLAWWVDQSMRQGAQSLTGPVLLVIENGSSLNRVARQLDQAGLLSSRDAFVWYARYHGLAQRIKAGEYEMPPGISGVEVLDKLVAGDVYLHTVTLVEGWTYREALLALQAHPAIRATQSANDPARTMAELGRADLHPEGRFFPDTYRFERDTTDLQLLRVALERMDAELERAWNGRKPAIPVETPDELLTLASIIEKETALDSERPEIAGVFARRLEKRMRLQTDPTVIYGLGAAFDGNLRRRDLTTDTPYNTYTRHGLPPTPICLPGRESLAAAADPAAGTSLFFVATGDPDGSHYFSETLEEHNAAVARYLKKLKSGANR